MNPRLQMSHLQTNILMTQIRAEKKTFNSTLTQQYNQHSYRHVDAGKKIFREILYRPSLSPV